MWQRRFFLNLGYMLANRKVQLPNQIHLRLLNDSGKFATSILLTKGMELSQGA